MSKSNGLTAELLEEIVAAFNRRDIEAITGYFAEDGVFVTARGSEPWGRRIVGPQAIGNYLEERFKVIPNMRWVDGRNWVAGNRGVSELAGRGNIRGWRGNQLARLRYLGVPGQQDRLQGYLLEIRGSAKGTGRLSLGCSSRSHSDQRRRGENRPAPCAAVVWTV
jgi:hypothetical protein